MLLAMPNAWAVSVSAITSCKVYQQLQFESCELSMCIHTMGTEATVAITQGSASITHHQTIASSTRPKALLMELSIGIVFLCACMCMRCLESPLPAFTGTVNAGPRTMSTEPTQCLSPLAWSDWV